MDFLTAIKGTLEHVQSKLNFEDWSQFSQFSTKKGLGRVACLTLFLSVIGTFHFVAGLGLLLFLTNHRDNKVDSEYSSFLTRDRYLLLLQWCAYMTSITIFHLLEFFVTAIWNATMADADSFLVNHSLSYTAAFLASCAEFWVRWILYPSIWKMSNTTWPTTAMALPWIGLVLVIQFQTIRSLAMATAGESFNHIIQLQKKHNHVLVTHGIYSILRHPSYVGFFYWSISLQLVLGNILNAVAFAVLSWGFFNRRIPYEEETLCQLFPNEYPAYVARTWMGLPFIRSTIVTPAKTKESDGLKMNEPQDSVKRD